MLHNRNGDNWAASVRLYVNLSGSWAVFDIAVAVDARGSGYLWFPLFFFFLTLCGLWVFPRIPS